MADNDRFVIKKIIKGFTTIDLIISEKDRQEYEDIILQTINEELDKVLKMEKKINNIGLAKAVVDRLFGEGK